MRFVVRTLIHTKPGERDQALAIAKKVMQLESANIRPSRIISAVFSSDSSPDLVMEMEVEADQFMTGMQQMEEMFQQKDFQDLNAEFVKHLSRAAKSEVYMIEE